MASEPEPRINLVLAGRKITPWAKALGLPSSTQQKLKSGETVTSDALTHVQRVENVNLSWLLTGRGRPFLIHQSGTDDEAAEFIAMLLADEPSWIVGVAWSEHRVCAILTLPATVQTKTKTIAYTALEVVTDCGPLAVAALCEARDTVRSYRFSDAEFERLVTGQLGTYSILTPGDTPRPTSDVPCELVAERVTSTAHIPYLTPDERVVLDHYRAMDAAAKTAYKSVGASMEKRTAGSAANVGERAHVVSKQVKR